MWQIIFVIYGVLCLYIAFFKPSLIWKMKKFEIMSNMFKGDRNLQIFVAVWGIAAILIGVLVFGQ
jgi:uncharacterized Tic20 family protein